MTHDEARILSMFDVKDYRFVMCNNPGDFVSGDFQKHSITPVDLTDESDYQLFLQLEQRNAFEKNWRYVPPFHTEMGKDRLSGYWPVYRLSTMSRIALAVYFSKYKGE